MNKSIQFALDKKNLGRESSYTMRQDAERKYDGPIPQEVLNAIAKRSREEHETNSAVSLSKET
jgi:hypothetical protein